MKKTHKIGVIGLGYVGLPLSVVFSKKYKVIGYDINSHACDAANNRAKMANIRNFKAIYSNESEILNTINLKYQEKDYLKL